MYIAELTRPLPLGAMCIYLTRKHIKETYIMDCMWLQATGQTARDFKRYGERIINKNKKQNDNRTKKEIAKDMLNDMRKKKLVLNHS